MELNLYVVIAIVPVLPLITCLKEFDPKCRYTVHLPEASWHTAYDVCQERNKTLANISVLADLYMVDLVLKEVDKFILQDGALSSGVWFNGFIRVSNQNNSVEGCTSLDCSLPLRVTSMNLEDGMLCLYYNSTDLNIYPEDCNKSKAFICESKNKGPMSCLENSKRLDLRDNSPYNLCWNEYLQSSLECELGCISSKYCYTFQDSNDNCFGYIIKNDSSCTFGISPPLYLKHKSIFLFNNQDYPPSGPKSLDDRCSDPKPLSFDNPKCHETLSVPSELSWEEYGPKCRYSVRMPEASWHTAYDVCEQSNQILAKITSLSEMYIMEDLLSDMDKLFVDPVINVSVGFWIGGFVRASDKKSLTSDCKSLDLLSAIDVPNTEFTKEIVCLYYNRTAMKIYTDDCQKTRPFICESIEEGPSSCLETSERTSLRERIPQMLCLGSTYPSLTKTRCETTCIKLQRCYTGVINSNNDCQIYRYEDKTDCNLGRNPPIYLQHMSFFKFSSLEFPVSDPKPFADWCPEPKKIMVLPEKSCNVPTRTKQEDFIISKGWESIEIFNDLDGDMKSKMAVVLDDNEGTCFPLPNQEDFTPFLMMRMPTEPVFGIQAKAFTLTISGMGISCDKHSNARMLQVSYKAIKEPTQFCTLTDNKAVPTAFSSCVFRCDCTDPAHCKDVNLYLSSGNAKGAWSLCEVKATNS